MNASPSVWAAPKSSQIDRLVSGKERHPVRERPIWQAAPGCGIAEPAHARHPCSRVVVRDDDHVIRKEGVAADMICMRVGIEDVR